MQHAHLTEDLQVKITNSNELEAGKSTSILYLTPAENTLLGAGEGGTAFTSPLWKEYACIRVQSICFSN